MTHLLFPPGNQRRQHEARRLSFVGGMEFMVMSTFFKLLTRRQAMSCLVWRLGVSGEAEILFAGWRGESRAFASFSCPLFLMDVLGG